MRLFCNKNVPLKHQMPTNTSLNSLHNFCVSFLTCFLISFLFWTCKEIIFFDVIIINDYGIISAIWICNTVCAYIAPLKLPCFLFVCTLPLFHFFVNFLSLCLFVYCIAVDCQYIYGFYFSMSRRAWPFPGTAKNLPNSCLYMWPIVTLQVPIHGNIVLLHVLGQHFHFFVAAKYVFFKFLQICPYAGHCLHGLPEPQWPYFFFPVQVFWQLVLFTIPFSLTITVCNLRASTQLNPAGTYSVATILMPFLAVSSCMISISMSLSFWRLMNCCFKWLSTSL